MVISQQLRGRPALQSVRPERAMIHTLRHGAHVRTLSTTYADARPHLADTGD